MVVSREAVSSATLAWAAVLLRGQLGAAALRRLEPLHDLEHDLLESALAVGQRGDLVLQALQLLGRGDLAGVEALLVALGAGADLVDVALGLGQLAAEVALLGLGLDELVAQRRPAARRARSAGRARAACGAGGRAGRSWCPAPARRAGAAGRRRGLSAGLLARDGGAGGPRIGDEPGHPRLHRIRPVAEPAAQQPFAVGQPGPLAGPVAARRPGRAPRARGPRTPGGAAGRR